MNSVPRCAESSRFDSMSAFLVANSFVRPTRAVMAAVCAMSGLATVLLLGTNPSFSLAAAGVVSALFCVALTWFWLTKWPTRQQSHGAVLAGMACTAGWAALAPDVTVSAMVGTAAVMTSCYVAFFHCARLLAANILASVCVAAMVAVRMLEQHTAGVAASVFWIMCMLNSVLPAAVRGMSLAMSTYATRSNQDPLTGLLNRRGFNEAVQHQLGRDRDACRSLSILMVDLDQFKLLNDTHGHDAGDRVLTAVASLLFRHCPVDAILSRAGGEEFVIAIFGTQDAAALAAQLCSEIANLPLTSSASIGVASARLDSDGDTAAIVGDLVAAADTAMYAAKRDGGNRARSHDL